MQPAPAVQLKYFNVSIDSAPSQHYLWVDYYTIINYLKDTFKIRYHIF